MPSFVIGQRRYRHATNLPNINRETLPAGSITDPEVPQSLQLHFKESQGFAFAWRDGYRLH
jgi:hypothetical protein